MKFQPRRYLATLLKEAVGNGAIVHENSDVTSFGEGYVTANGHRISYEHVVIATHVPLQGESGTLGAALFQTKLALYSTYALAAKLPAGTLEEMIWSDTAEPFNYLRIDHHEEGDIAIFGGEDHKTGQCDDTPERFDALQERLAELIPEAIVTHRWSGQVVETPDDLPFIGQTRERQFIATGYSGNGMTFGTIAARMARDAILGIENPWSTTFVPGRKVLSSLREFLSENVDYPAHLVMDRFRASGEPAASLIACRGKVIEHGSGGFIEVVDKLKESLNLAMDRPNALRQALMACRKAGTVSIPGVYIGLLDKIPFGAAMNKGLTLKMGQTHVQRYLAPLLEMIEAGTIDPSFVISHRIPIDEAPTAYEKFRTKSDDCIKVVIKPGMPSLA